MHDNEAVFWLFYVVVSFVGGLIWFWIMKSVIAAGTRHISAELRALRDLLHERLVVPASSTTVARTTNAEAENRGHLQTARAPSASEVNPDAVTAIELLRRAETLHFSKQFREAVAVYSQLVEQFPDSKQATTARQQLVNLSRSH